MLIDSNVQEEERNRILAAATKCVRRSGCRNTSIEMISVEAGIDPATLRQHFAYVEDIYATLAIGHLEIVENDIAGLGPDADPAAILRAQLEQSKRWRENGDAFLFFNLLSEVEHNSAIRTTLRNGRNYAKAAFARAISEGKVKGTIAGEVDEDSVAALISAMVHASLIMRLFDSESEVEKINALLVRLVKDLTKPAKRRLVLRRESSNAFN